MSIHSKTKRVERLEAKNRPPQTVEPVIWKVMGPTPNGPGPTGEAIAWICSGSSAGAQIKKAPHETWDEFEARVEAVQ